MILILAALLAAPALALNGHQMPGSKMLTQPINLPDDLSEALTFWAPLNGSTNAYGAGNTTPTFTRATVASHLGSNGLLVKDASGAPRFEQNGYRAEGPRSNLILQAEAMNTTANWVTDASSVAANAGPDPFGTTTAEAIVEDSTANSLHGIYQGYTRTASKVECISVYAAAAGGTWLVLGLNDGGGGNEGLPLVNSAQNGSFETFNLSTGALGSQINVGTGWTAAGATISAVPGAPGVYRCTLNVTGPTGTSASLFVGIGNGSGATSYNGAGSNSIFCSSAQAEDNAPFPSSYIPTTSAAVTRNTESLSWPSAGNTPSNNEATTMALWWDTDGAATMQVAAGTTNSGYANGFETGTTGTNKTPRGVVISAAGGAMLNVNSGTMTAGVPKAFGWSSFANFSEAFINNSSIGKSTTAGITTHSALAVGNNAAASTRPLYGHARGLLIFKAKLENSDMTMLAARPL